MTVQRMKTWVLILLVLISLLLSYQLWRGAWLNDPEPGLSAPTVHHGAPYPQLSQVTKPLEIDVFSEKRNAAALIPPDSADYRQWTDVLKSLQTQRLRHETVSPSTATTSVTFPFGLELERTDLSRWLPALRLSPLDVAGSEIQLYQAVVGGPVELAVTFGSDRYSAQTDVDPARFQHLVALATAHYPAQVWRDEAGNQTLVPVHGRTMPRITCVVSKPALLQLVHSFFVNPDALTRIQENRHRVIWTDGTRAVQWDTNTGELTFDDPNTSSTAGNGGELQAVTTYIRAHGGATHDGVLLSSDDRSLPGVHAYQLQPVFAGFRVFGTHWTQQVQVENGHVVHYQRPFGNLSAENTKDEVRVMGADRLREVLQHLQGRAPKRAFTAVLGYWPVAEGDNQVELEPAYEVMRNGAVIGVIDAVGGQVLEGMKQG
ncbi:MAG: YycH family regulatory protein [Alicyclobacillus herbarius]|uniref:two-component system activity regulator YycH n=1 Tax=Alicyclobacillus herbarius TaxID=122960 RepID=UPI0023548721|nr:two-component system activity regulator YycH [Alicyclobacillus herbarius]MCL6631753.1 YycH family regulatory protein [Alicyclobacillus herbarius]